MAGEDAIACEAELARLLAEVGQQRSWQERAQEAEEVLSTAPVKVEGLRQDWEAARLEVARLAVELAAAEAARAAAQEAMDAVQDEARPTALLPDFTPRDVEVLCALRGMVASSGTPAQDLLEALQSAVTSRAAAMEAEAAATAAGLGADLAPGSGFGGHAVVGVQEYDPETVGPTPTSPAFAQAGAAAARGVRSASESAESNTSLSEVVERGLTATPCTHMVEATAGSAPVVPGSPPETQAFLPEAGVLLAQALPAPGGLEVHEEQEEEAARLRPRSPSSLMSAL